MDGVGTFDFDRQQSCGLSELRSSFDCFLNALRYSLALFLVAGQWDTHFTEAVSRLSIMSWVKRFARIWRLAIGELRAANRSQGSRELWAATRIFITCDWYRISVSGTDDCRRTDEVGAVADHKDVADGDVELVRVLCAKGLEEFLADPCLGSALSSQLDRSLVRMNGMGPVP